MGMALPQKTEVERLKDHLHDLRGEHFRLLSVEYQKLADEFAAKAGDARRAYEGFQETKRT